MGFFSRLFSGMQRTKKSFGEKLKYLFTGNDIDEEFFEELEFTLLSSDIGATATDEILDELRLRTKQKKLKTTNECKALLKEIIVDILNENQAQDFSYPCVIMVLGVNGVGKTTTIGKMAKKFEKMGKKVVLAAADTFRAAASDQLEVWADRSKVKIVTNEQGSDSGAVVFDAISSAKAKKADVLIIDTAGRLHNKANLMEELKKISKIVGQNFGQAEYHKLLVIDATTGQNAISQVELFNKAVDVTDLAITKLDGTAKGGVIIGLSKSNNIPVRYVGVGETADDLLDFNAQDFVDAIFDE